ncbi:MAG: YybH family protein [Acidobacteriota bacterium]
MSRSRYAGKAVRSHTCDQEGLIIRPIFLALAIAVIATPAAAQGRAADEAAVRARITVGVEAINRRDAAGWAALFTPDADVIVLDGPRAEGRAAIQALAAKNWAAAPNERATITPTAIRFLGSDIAIVNTTARFTGGAAPGEDRGTWVLQRQAGTWLITALRVMPAGQP